MFEYYVMNEENGKIAPFNIFRNYLLDDAAQKEVKKYLRAPNKYKYETYDKETFYGFEAFCKQLGRLIAWQEHFRCEYEVSIGSLFDRDGETFRKIDCYMQCEKNIPMIAREVIWQWKHREDNKHDI